MAPILRCFPPCWVYRSTCDPQPRLWPADLRERREDSPGSRELANKRCLSLGSSPPLPAPQSPPCAPCHTTLRFHLCQRKPLEASAKQTKNPQGCLLPPRFLALVFKTEIVTENDVGGFRNISFKSQPPSKHFNQRSPYLFFF